MANLSRRGNAGPPAPSRTMDPFELMRELLLRDPLSELIGPGDGFVPTFEVKETKDTYRFKADLPGVREEDLELSLTGNRLTIAGKREEEHRQNDERIYAYERSYGSFSRSFTLPEGIDADHATADLSSGVLTITLPKKPEVQPKKLEVKKGQGTQRAKA